MRVDLTADGGHTWTSVHSLEQDTAHHPRHWGWTIWKVGLEDPVDLLAGTAVLEGAWKEDFSGDRLA